MTYETENVSTLDLIAALQECERQFPLSRLMRSSNGTGNIIIFDANDTYVGVITFNDPPKLSVYGRGERS